MKIATKKIIIGTAQLNTNYGVTNFKKFQKKNKLKILEYAWNKGIRSFDTAPYYGDAEKILGEFIKINNLKNEIKVFTKINIANKKKNFSDNINFSIDQSLKNLNLEQIECIYVSKESDLDNINKKNIQNIKKKFNINLVGVSIYGDFKKKKFLNKKFDLFQVPVNIASKNKYNYLKDKYVIARSIFLQGLLLNTKTKFNIPKRLKLSLVQYFSYLNKIKITPLEATLTYIYYQNQIRSFIIGVDDEIQLKKILDTKVKKINKVYLSMINKIFNEEDLDPRKW